MTVILALDTSSPKAYVALSAGDRIVKKVSRASNSHNEELATLIECVCDEAQVSPREISQIVLGGGPGSFTGLRIGFSLAKGLAIANRASLSRISSFAAAAYAHVNQGHLLIPLADARRAEIFCAGYLTGQDKLKTVLEPGLMAHKELENTVDRLCEAHAIKPADACCVTLGELECSGSLRLIAAARLAQGLLAAYSQSRPSGAATEGFNLASIAEIEPEYIRAVAARTIHDRLNSVS